MSACFKLLFGVLLPTILLFPADSLNDDHAIQKRAESNQEPHFKTGDLVVDEFAGTVMVCVLGGQGNARRSLGIYTAKGMDERCPRRPCPPATEGADYERLFETYFELRQGERFCRSITIINDQVVEGREFFLVVLEDLRWGEILDSLAVVIEDEDSPTFISSVQSIREDGGSLSVCIMGGITNETVAIQTQNTSSVANGATVDQDYTYVYREIFISPGRIDCVNISILNDTLYEGHETFEVVMSAVSGTVSNFSSSSAVVTILEDDERAQFGDFNQIINENDGTSRVCVIFMDDSTVMVQGILRTANSTAIAGFDYEELIQVFSIQGGEEKCFDLIIYDDNLPEPNERIILELNSSNNALRSLITSQLTIVDDDVLDFVETTYAIGENDISIPICVRLVSGIDSVITGSIKTSNLDAEAGVDYFSIDATFSLSGTQQRCFNFISINDNIPELTETAVVTVMTFNSLGQVAERRQVFVSIMDDDVDLCVVLREPDNGNIVAYTNGQRAGSLVIYLCNFGYQIAGSNIRQCLLNGSWTLQDPTCEAIMCPILPDPEFGMVQLTGRALTSKALYSCLRGFRIMGNQERECVIPGIWSGNQPVCSEILCPVLPNITDGFVIIDSRSVDSVAVYNCSAGFEVVGIDERVCLENGSWNGTEPLCKATIDVPLPGPVGVQFVNGTPQINGSNVSVNFVTMGSIDAVLCEFGDYSILENFANRNSGSMTFPDMKPGVYMLKVTASNTLTGETSTKESFIEISNDPDFCGLHLINSGLIVTGNSIHVEFAGVPKHINTFRCKLDNKPGFDCYGDVDLENIEPGAHRLKIMHNRDQCGPRRKIFLHFTIDNS